MFSFLRSLAWLSTFSGFVLSFFVKVDWNLSFVVAFAIFALFYLLNLTPGAGNWPWARHLTGFLMLPLFFLLMIIALNWFSWASIAGILMLVGFIAFLLIGYPFLGRPS